MSLNDKYVGSLCARQHHYLDTGGSLRTKYGECVECRKLASRKYIKAHRLRHNEHTSKWNRQWKSLYPVRNLCRNLKSRSKVSNLPYDLDSEYLEQLLQSQNHKCYWLGIDIDLNKPGKHPGKATLDRLIPQNGYTKGNVVWASNFANRGRVDLPVEEFEEFVRSLMEAKK